ncbi:putative nuclease HARBI1 [Belonocnema kinseyi]|uniref:putative nuclease HARBI1 n=1 Tax=Belonocnema kinseyi TaxID=2817044 RepID=UPI00143DDC1D|nr:putative nuclease HARBI1 [Belonocnema kinseyi]
MSDKENNENVYEYEAEENDDEYDEQYDEYEQEDEDDSSIDFNTALIQENGIGGENAETFRNRKGYFSINVQTITNANLEIIDIVARWQGSVHDSTIFSNSRINAMFEAGQFGKALLKGDGGYPLKPHLMTPLNAPNTPAEQLYNESLIKTRNSVELEFGVWKRRFPIMALGVRFKLANVLLVIVATAVLHNIARRGEEKPIVDPNVILPAPLQDLILMENIKLNDAL